MATNFGKICGMTFIQHAGISKQIWLSQFWLKIFSGNIFSTYCANLIKIGPVTPEKLQIVLWFDDRRSFATWRSEMDWKIKILISAG